MCFVPPAVDRPLMMMMILLDSSCHGCGNGDVTSIGLDVSSTILKYCQMIAVVAVAVVVVALSICRHVVAQVGRGVGIVDVVDMRKFNMHIHVRTGLQGHDCGGDSDGQWRQRRASQQ